MKMYVSRYDDGAEKVGGNEKGGGMDNPLPTTSLLLQGGEEYVSCSLVGEFHFIFGVSPSLDGLMKRDGCTSYDSWLTICKRRDFTNWCVTQNLEQVWNIQTSQDEQYEQCIKQHE